MGLDLTPRPDLWPSERVDGIHLGTAYGPQCLTLDVKRRIEMGYYTNYYGELTISPPITAAERDRLAALVGIERPNEKDVFNPPTAPTAEDLELRGSLEDSLWCWTLTPDTLSTPEGDVKGYDTADGLTLAHSWLKANGHTLEGEISWAGESNDDSGVIYVDAVHGVEAVQDVRDNPGPSWKKVAA